MALFRRFFYRKPPEGLLEVSERVFVFNSCFATNHLEGKEYQVYVGHILKQLREYFPDASFMIFNFGDGDPKNQITNVVSEYGMTLIEYPRQYVNCPVLTLEFIHHFLRSGESWLSIGQRNVLLMHCETAALPLLVFMLAAFLIYSKQYPGEQRTLDMIYKQAPRELLPLLSPLNPVPSQLRYLQYVSRRNIGSQWPPLDRALTLDCIILRFIPNMDGEGGCRPIFRIYGQDPLMAADRTTKVLYSMPKKSKAVGHFKQADCELAKIDINCHVQGDVLIECITLDDNLENEEMMFRVMFNTSFIRSNILMLSRDEIDMLWNAKDQFSTDFRLEVLFSEMDSSSSLAGFDLPGIQDNEGLPIEAFAEIQEIFGNLDLKGSTTDIAHNMIQKMTASSILREKLEITASADARNEKWQNVFPKSVKGEQLECVFLQNVMEKMTQSSSLKTNEATIMTGSPQASKKENFFSIFPNSVKEGGVLEASPAIVVESRRSDAIENDTRGSAPDALSKALLASSGLSSDLGIMTKKSESNELQVSVQRPAQSKIISLQTSLSSLSNPASFSNSLQSSPSALSRYHSTPSVLGITALLHDHADISNREVSSPLTQESSISASASCPWKPVQPNNFCVSSPPEHRPLELSIDPKLRSEDFPLHPSRPSPPPRPPPPPPPLSPSTQTLTPQPQLFPFIRDSSLASADLSIDSKSESEGFPLQSLPSPPPPPPPPLSTSTQTLTLQPQSLPSIMDSSLPSAIPPPPPPPSSNVSPAQSSSATATPTSTPLHVASSITCQDSSMVPEKSSTSTSGLPSPPQPQCSGSTTSGISVAPPPSPPPYPISVPKKDLARACEIVPPPPPPAPQLNSLSKNGAASLQMHSSVNIPAPPLGAKEKMLSKTSTRNQGQSKKTSLKPYHWLKLTRVIQGSLWAEAQKPEEASKAPELDMSELESLFSAAVQNLGHGGSSGKANRHSSRLKPDKVHLIELRRAYNCEIMLSKVKVPLSDLMNSVLALDDSALDVDQVDNLIKFCPTKEEMELLTNYNGDQDSLGKCEQFFLALMKVPRVESKLRVFSFKIQFFSQVSDLRNSLNSVSSVSEEVRKSVKLKRIMQTVLSLGNALNHGTARGSAVGFRLDSLLKLTETRAQNNKLTLMHYLCKVLAEKLPNVIDFRKDLVNLEAASKIQLKYLAEEMQSISKGLEKVVQELTLSEYDGAVSKQFCKILKEFYESAEVEVRSLSSLYSGVGRQADALALYFGEDPARCPFEQVISTLLNFVRMFQRAHEENCKQLEFEKKEAEKEAENGKEKWNSSRKKS